MSSNMEVLQELYSDVKRTGNIKLSTSELSQLLQNTLLSHVKVRSLSQGGSNSNDDCKDSKTFLKKSTAKDELHIHNKTESKHDKRFPVKKSEIDKIHSCIKKTKDVLRVEQHGKKTDCVHKEIQSCQKEVLLMLTCIKIMVESETEVEDDVNASTHCQTITALADKEIILSLLELTVDEDKFVSYASLKTILTIVKSNKFQNERETLLEEVVHRVKNCRQPGSHYFHILKHFMSKRLGVHINRWCYQSLNTSSVFSSDIFQNVLLNIDDLSIDKPFTFLELLQKTVKYLNRLDHVLVLDELSAIVPQMQEELLPFLVRCLQHIDCCPRRMIARKTLDVFNILMNYSSCLANMKVIPCLYSQTADKLLSVLSPSVILSVPYVKEWIGFGGNQVESCNCLNQNGDLSLLRKLILVLLKSCAITTKCDPIRAQHVVIDCLTSLSKLVEKAFPSSPDEMQWLPLVFGDQDDSWIETLLCLLDIHIHSHRTDNPLLLSLTDPHRVFLQFLTCNSSDSSVLVDLLTSPETCFLLYFLRYLKCVLSEWNQFTITCHSVFTHKTSSSNWELESSGTCADKLEEMSYSSQNDEMDVDYCSDAGTTEPSTKCSKSNHVEQTVTGYVDVSSFKSSNKLLGPTPATVAPLKGLASLAVYESDSDSSEDEIDQDLMEITVLSKIPTSQTYSDHFMEVNLGSKVQTLETQSVANRAVSRVCTTIPCDSLQTDSLLSARKQEESHDTMKLSTGGSTLSCDLQCVDQVMSTMIRVRLRIERMTEQELFPYNPAPLVSLIEQCENLYENMDS